MTFLALAFAGIGKLILAYVVSFGLVGILLFAALGTQLVAGIPVVGPKIAEFLAPLRHDLLAAAVVVFGATLWGAHMQRLEHDRCVAQTVVITKTVDHVVTKSKTVHYKDPNDSPEN